MRYGVNGKAGKMRIGFYPTMTLAETRQSASDTLAQAAVGVDPRAKSEDPKKFKDIWPEYVNYIKRKDRMRARAGKRTTAASSLLVAQRVFYRKFVPHLGEMNIDEIQRHHVSASVVPSYTQNTLPHVEG